ncbi:MAG: hypothetical protein ACIAQF_05970 [Phycisphaerales bacterium JB065]
MSLVAALRARSIRPLIDEAARSYTRPLDHEQRHAAMLDRLNAVWATAIRHTPRYRKMYEAGTVPERFESLQEYADTVPPLTKQDMRGNTDELTDERRPAENSFTTGGSTGRPTSIPGWHAERQFDLANRWLGRSFYAITPSDSLFLIWGHHHLLGSGWKGKAKGRIRSIKDALLGLTRFSAYDISEERCEEAGRLILRRKPQYIIGYSSTLDLLARTQSHRASEFAQIGLKATIATAEVYPSSDSRKRIAETFGCPAAMEYGTVETGVMAYTHPSGGFRVFWRDHLFELGEPGPGGGRVLRITSLYERKTPLIRYEIGDEIMPFEGEPLIGPARITSVLGRVNSIVTLIDGKAVHTAAISRAISDREDVRQFQIIDRPDGLCLKIVAATNEAKPQILNHVRRNLAKLSPTLSEAPVVFVSRIQQTKAGKTPLVVQKSDPDEINHE